jgi:Phage P22-like portal protein
MADDDDKSLKGDEKIIQEAKKRFKRVSERESIARQRFVADTKFCEGDSDNGYQWDDSVRKNRMAAAGGPRPCITINKTKQNCLIVINDQRENKTQIEIRPVGDGATYDAAKIYEGIVRHIEYNSKATAAYDTAYYHMVVGGIGYLRVLTDYVDAKSFDQEIYIRRIPDPLSVYLDCDIQQYDGSDASWGFIFRDEPRDAFESEYPDLDMDEVGGGRAFSEDQGSLIGLSGDDWVSKDHVRVAEYYRKQQKPDRLVLMADGSRMLKSEMREDGYEEAKQAGHIVNERDTVQDAIEWFKIAGDKIIDRRDWPGVHIPIVRVVGEETIINGELDRKGMTRALKDPNRIYNYWSSSAIEHVALQSKSPYIGQKDAFEGLEGEWNNANQDNKPYIPYNGRDEQGQPIPMPTRQAPPVMPQAYIQGMQTAQQEMMMAWGQYQSQFGEEENAKSGVAIQTRQRQGDKATYGFIDHFAQSLRYLGMILIDLIPKIYDTPRIIKIMAEDGDQTEVNIDPNGPVYQQKVNGQPASEEQVKQAQGDPNLKDKIETIFNPTVGKYDVEADIGPAYSTRRQETFNALSQMIAQNQELGKIALDLLFKAADFPMADEIAERCKRAIPANILGIGPPPEVQQLQQQNQALHSIIQELSQQLNTAQGKVKQGMDDSEIKVYDAETRRISAMNQIDQEALKPIVRELVSQVLGTPVLPIMDAHAEADQARMPQEQPETVQ